MARRILKVQHFHTESVLNQLYSNHLVVVVIVIIDWFYQFELFCKLKTDISLHFSIYLALLVPRTFCSYFRLATNLFQPDIISLHILCMSSPHDSGQSDDIYGVFVFLVAEPKDADSSSAIVQWNVVWIFNFNAFVDFLFSSHVKIPTLKDE